MLLRLCQLKSLTLLLLVTLMSLTACSWNQQERPGPLELLTTFSNHWFSHNPKHSLINSNKEPSPHLLFDTTPEFKPEDRLVNAVVAVPEGSPHSYAIDLSSGQRYFTHSYCKQKDVWNTYPSTIHRPPFSIGFIPRVLDQLGDPQKVIIFTRQRSFIETATSNFHRIRLIGSYVEQICPEGNCLGKNNWVSKLVFIGVDAEDASIAGIESTTDFTKVFDWETAKAHLENIDGRNFIGDKTHPAVKVGQLIEYKDAFEYFKKQSIFLTDAELKKIQKGCHILYDRLWDDVGKIRPEDLGAHNAKELNAKLELQKKLKKEKLPVGFAERFKGFGKKYFKEITTCEKFVYHGNVNRDPETFWFLSYMGIYYRLNREGYFFDCKNKSWQRNVMDTDGRPIYNFVRDINNCKEAEIDQAMSYLSNFINGLKGETEYYRFVDYDNHPFGTHSKLYSWVKMKTLKFDCRNDPNVEIKKEMKLFPEEVSWKPRLSIDTAEESKIIR
jgi:hypothetical protein